MVQVGWAEVEDWMSRIDQQDPLQVLEALAQVVGSLRWCNSSVQAGRTAAVAYILGSSLVGIAVADRSRMMGCHSPFEIAWRTCAESVAQVLGSLIVL